MKTYATGTRSVRGRKRLPRQNLCDDMLYSHFADSRLYLLRNEVALQLERLKYRQIRLVLTFSNV